MKHLLNHTISTTALTLVAALAHQATASGTSVYQYKDANGGLYLTNIQKNGGGSEKFTQVSVTHYQDTKLHSNPTQIPVTYNPTTASTPSRSANRNSYDHLIRAAATRHGVDPALIKAVIHTESAFNPNARSPVGAMGLMQLMPGTARDMGVSNAWDPAQNIEGGVKYLAWLKRQFSNLDYVIAAYNAGHGNVKKYRGIPPFRETQNYVKSVKSRYNTLYRHDNSLMAGFGQTVPQLAQAQPVTHTYQPTQYQAQQTVSPQQPVVYQQPAQTAQYRVVQAQYQQPVAQPTIQPVSYATSQNPSATSGGRIYITNGTDTYQR